MILCSFCGTGEAVNLVIHSPSAPAITLQEVQFHRHSDTLGDISEFRAVLDAPSRHWMNLSVRVELKLKNGKSLSFTAGGQREPGADSFEVYGFVQPDASNAPSQVVGHDVTLIEGTVVETKQVRAYSGLIATDEACYRDLLKASALDGLAQRKALSELLRLGCAANIQEPMEVVAQRPLNGWPNAAHVALAPDAYSKHDGISGVVPVREIYTVNMPVKRKYCGPVNANQWDCANNDAP